MVKSSLQIMMFSLLVMFAAACGGGTSNNSASIDKPLEETYWTLTRMDGSEVVALQKRSEAHLIFKKEDSRVAGSGGCNRIMGKYTLDGARLSFSQIAGTMMACPNLDEEHRFLQALGMVETYSISGDVLDMSAAGKVILEFKAEAK